MNQTQTTAQAATAYFEQHLISSSTETAHDDFLALQKHLGTFDNPSVQITYLNQIEVELKSQLQTHRDTFHGGQPKPTCKKEIRIDQLRSYIQQELAMLSHIA